MPIEITVPRLGWSMDEGAFHEWLKRDGETVAPGDLLFALDSDKVTQEVETLDGGILYIPPGAPQPGDQVVVGQLLGYLLAEGESIPVAASVQTAPTPVPPASASASPTPVVEEGILAARETAITPRARRIAREMGIDWIGVSGTGGGGRIREADIRAKAQSHQSSTLSRTRRRIAERMLASQQKTAAVTLHTTADASALVRLRTEAKASTSAPSYNDMLVKLVAGALCQHPALNSRWDGDNLLASPAIHIALAVETDEGLLAPVIRDAAGLSLGEIAARSQDIIARALSKRLTPEELRGATFTITNLGPFGIDAFTPIINYPECAILGVGRIVRQPVAVGDAMALRDVITLSLTFDHCALDGGPAARFLQTLTNLIERPREALGIA